MPWSLVGRSGSMAVSLLSQAHAESFSLGLGSFVNEARLLTRFDRPSLVKVHRYWGVNNTAYMACMAYMASSYYIASNLHGLCRRMALTPDARSLEDQRRSRGPATATVRHRQV